MDRPLAMVSLCSGVGGLELGLEAALDAHTVLQVEKDEFCRAVLAKHWPLVSRLEDVAVDPSVAVNVAASDPIDIVCMGFPCQPHSVAGARKGLADDRWIWPACANWVRVLRPRLVVIENVPGLLTSSEGEAYASVLSDLHDLGYDARWRTISVADVGGPHRRKRVVIVAHRRGLAGLDRPRSAGTGICWDHPGWPARPGERQYAYEPTRVSAKTMNRPFRLKALGNAVSPYVAQAVGEWAREALAGCWGDVAGKVVVALQGGRKLPRQGALFPEETPSVGRVRWPKHGSMVRGVVRQLLISSEAVTDRFWPDSGAGSVNPDWVDLLMGFPIGWTEIEMDMKKRRVASKPRAKRTKKGS